MTQDDQFCLKWNEFQQCIKSTFQDLRGEADFMDVTLACDGQQIKAHKVILSACSSTLRNLLKKNPSQNPVILLWDVSPRDLNAILDFMYNGEVNVKQEHLNSFLSVAEKLHVRGLCQDGKPSSTSSAPASRADKDGPSGVAAAATTPSSLTGVRPRNPANNDTSSHHHQSSTPLIPSKRRKFSASADNDIEEIPPAVKQEKSEAATSAAAQADMMIVNPQDFGPESEDYGEYYEEDGGYGGGGVDPVDPTQSSKGAYCLQSCQYCKSCFYDEQTLDQHITTAHHFDKVRNHQTTTSSYLECNFCGKLFKNLNTLRNHKSLYHKGEK